MRKNTFDNGVKFAVKLIRAAWDRSEMNDPEGQPITGHKELNELLKDIRQDWNEMEKQK